MKKSSLDSTPVAPGEQADSRPIAGRKRPGRKLVSRAPDSKAYGRSRITNGTALLPGTDQRSPWIRRCKDVIAAHLSDTPDASAAERSIIRRAAVLTVELEQLEVKFATAGVADRADLDLYQRTAGNLRRLLEAVGLQRRARDVTPTIAQILAEDEAARAAAKAAEVTRRGRKGSHNDD